MITSVDQAASRKHGWGRRWRRGRGARLGQCGRRQPHPCREHQHNKFSHYLISVRFKACARSCHHHVAGAAHDSRPSHALTAAKSTRKAPETQEEEICWGWLAHLRFRPASRMALSPGTPVAGRAGEPAGSPCAGPARPNPGLGCRMRSIPLAPRRLAVAGCPAPPRSQPTNNQHLRRTPGILVACREEKWTGFARESPWR